MKLYVGNLSFSTSESELKALFENYGTVASASIIIDRNSGRSKGFGFVEMANDEEANAAIEGVNGKSFGDRSLKVNEARPIEERPARRSFGNRKRY